MSGLTFTSHETVKALAGLEATWRELHDECTYPSFFNSFDFVMASVIAFTEPGIELFVLSAMEADTVVAIFPFQLSTFDFYGVSLKKLEYAAQWEIDKPYPIIRGGYEAIAWRELYRFLAENHKRWHCFNLVEVREGLAGTMELERLYRLPKYWLRIKEDDSSPVMALDQPLKKRWEAHRKMRKKVNRMENAFGERLRFQVFDGPGAGQDWLSRYVELESKGWKAGKVGIGKDESTLSFYQDLFARLAARGQLSFGVLFVDDEPASIEIAYIQGRFVYFSHGTFDERYANYSPGMVSTTCFLSHFHSGDFDEGDYLAGFASYIAPWADRLVASNKLVIYRTSAAVLYALGIKALRRLLPRRRRISADQCRAT